jgi:hypothetical protein
MKTWLRPLGVYVASRVVVWVTFSVAMFVHPGLRLHDIIHSWDGSWYLDTAVGGYPNAVPVGVNGKVLESHLGFFPLFPIGIRALHAVGIPYTAAALIISFVAGGVAMALLWLLVRRIMDAEIADRSIVLMCFFPGSLVASLAYTETMMLALSVGCLFFLLQRRWWQAGLCAGLATAARPTALVLVVCCAWCAFFEIRERGKAGLPALVAPALAPVGILAFFAFLAVHAGSFTAYLRTQRDGWDERFEVTSAYNYMQRLWRGNFADLNLLIIGLGLVVSAVLIVLLVLMFLRSEMPAVLMIYSLGLIALALLSSSVGLRPRFIWVAFPLIVAAARYVKGTAFSTLAGCAGLLLGLYTLVVVFPQVTP